MLQPVYLLESDVLGLPTLRRLGRRAWQAQLIIPRAQCVFESLPCRGLAWHEQRAFARLQARRLAPFTQTGGNAAIRGGRLMLWLWDHAEALAAADRAGMRPAAMRAVRVWAEPLLQPPPPAMSATLDVPCFGGEDRRSVADGAIVASEWHEGGTGAQQRATPVPAIAMVNQPWARELIGQRLSADAATVPSAALRGAALASATALIALGAGGAYAAYWGMRLQASREALGSLESQMQASMTRLGDAARWRERARADAVWLEALAQSSRGLDWGRLERTLRPVLQRHGVVVRELEVRGDGLRLTVASAGAAIDLPSVLRGLQQAGGLDAVQLRTDQNAALATFAMRIPGHLRSTAVPEGAAAWR